MVGHKSSKGQIGTVFNLKLHTLEIESCEATYKVQGKVFRSRDSLLFRDERTKGLKE